MVRRFSIVLIFVLFFLFYYSNFNVDFNMFLEKNNIEYLYLGDDTYSFKKNDLKSVLRELNFEKTNEKFIDDRLIIEGYSNMIINSKNINGRKNNIQISVFDDIVLLGIPLIKNSF